MQRRSILRAAACALAPAVPPLHAQGTHPHIAQLRRFLEQPESRIDYGTAKLAIDKMADPQLDIEAARQQLDALTTALQGMLRSGFMIARPVTTEIRIDALRTCLYRAGPWNDYRPFEYDLKADPDDAQYYRIRLLPNYLSTRLGNSISMPALFVILAQRIGLDATLSVAPEHLFVKVRGDDGQYVNIECTSGGGLKRDASYIREFEITPEALKNGLYLRPLTRRQTVGVASAALLERLDRMRDWRGMLALADLLTEFEPALFQTMATRTIAYQEALEMRFRERYRTWEAIPEKDRPEASRLLDGFNAAKQKLLASGWHLPSKEFEANYKRVVNEARGKS